MLPVPSRWIAMDQMQDGRPAANALTVDSPHTGNSFVQPPLLSHKVVLFLKTMQPVALAARSPTLQLSSSLISPPHKVGVPIANTPWPDIKKKSGSSVTIIKNEYAGADLLGENSPSFFYSFFPACICWQAPAADVFAVEAVADRLSKSLEFIPGFATALILHGR